MDRASGQGSRRSFGRVPRRHGDGGPNFGSMSVRRSGIACAIRDVRPPHPGRARRNRRLPVRKPARRFGLPRPPAGRIPRRAGAVRQPITGPAPGPFRVPHGAQFRPAPPNRSGPNSRPVRPARGNRPRPASVGACRGSAAGFPMVGNNGRLCPQPMGRRRSEAHAQQCRPDHDVRRQPSPDRDRRGDGRGDAADLLLADIELVPRLLRRDLRRPLPSGRPGRAHPGPCQRHALGGQGSVPNARTPCGGHIRQRHVFGNGCGSGEFSDAVGNAMSGRVCPDGRVLVALDGLKHFRSPETRCGQCPTRRVGGGAGYFHGLVGAASAGVDRVVRGRAAILIRRPSNACATTPTTSPPASDTPRPTDAGRCGPQTSSNGASGRPDEGLGPWTPSGAAPPWAASPSP